MGVYAVVYVECLLWVIVVISTLYGIDTTSILNISSQMANGTKLSLHGHDHD